MKNKLLNEKVKELKKELIEYEEIFDAFKREDNIVDNNPLLYLLSLILGIFFGLISVLIIIHTILSINNYFDVLE